MTLALKAHAQRPALARRVNLAVVVFLVFYLVIGFLQPAYLEPAGIAEFPPPRRARSPSLAAGQVFVLVSGGFDLLGRIARHPDGDRRLDADRPTIPPTHGGPSGVLYCIGLAVGLINGAVVAYLRTPSMRLPPLEARCFRRSMEKKPYQHGCGGSPRGYPPENVRMFGRFVFHDVPLVKIVPWAILVVAGVAALAW